MITIKNPIIPVEFNIAKTDYNNHFRSYWMGFCEGIEIKDWTPSENGDYINIYLEVNLYLAFRIIKDMLLNQFNSGIDIDFDDIRRLYEKCIEEQKRGDDNVLRRKAV